MDLRFHYGTALDMLSIPLRTTIPMRERLPLAWKMRRAQRKLPCASTYLEHLAMGEAILNVPREVPGVAVECGCFMGGSTASLSLACELAGRELVVFDSFSGLPDPDEDDTEHVVDLTAQAHVYAEGEFAGTLDQVRGNVARYGHLDACRFVPGFFQDTLPTFDEPVVFAFIDADLTESVKTCVRHLWPLLRDGCCMYVHEAHHREITDLFHDHDFWAELGEDPPGLIGGGSGLGLSVHKLTPLGYAVKHATVRERIAERY